MKQFSYNVFVIVAALLVYALITMCINLLIVFSIKMNQGAVGAYDAKFKKVQVSRL